MFRTLDRLAGALIVVVGVGFIVLAWVLALLAIFGVYDSPPAL